MKRFIPIGILFLFALLSWFFGLQKYLSLDMLRENYAVLGLYVKHYFILSLVVYFMLYTLLVALSIPGAFLMTIAGGLLFGQLVGTVVVVIAATIGATIIFLSMRYAAHDIIEKKAGRWLSKMKQGFQENAFSYMLTLRFIPLFPFVAINLVAAALQISLRSFFFGTLLGIIPGSFVYVSMGVALKEVIMQQEITTALIVDRKILIALAGLGLLSLTPILYRHFFKRQHP